MKFQAVCLGLYAAQTVAAAALNVGGNSRGGRISPPVHKRQSSPSLGDRRSLSRRSPQSVNTITALIGSILYDYSNYGVKEPPSKVPRITVTNSTQTPGAKRKTIRHGPYRIMPSSAKTLETQILGTEGIQNFRFGVDKPCDGDCLILRLSATLQYDDGSDAVNTDGAWLHHVVLTNMGPNVTELTCGNRKFEPLFESGNERTEISFTSPISGLKTGYRVRASDYFVLNSELMNMNEQEKWVWITLSYDYVEKTPEYKESQVLWLSVGFSRCTGSTENPFGKTNLTKTLQPTKLVFSEHSVPWTAKFDGFLMGTNSHLHDGAMSMEIYKNEEVICVSLPQYEKGGGMHMDGHAKRQMGKVENGNKNEHIVKQTPCIYNEPIPFKIGDTIFTKANYNFTQHAGTVNKQGEIEEVMGIVGILIVKS